jgi:hypothetical protein
MGSIPLLAPAMMLMVPVGAMVVVVALRMPDATRFRKPGQSGAKSFPASV